MGNQNAKGKQSTLANGRGAGGLHRARALAVGHGPWATSAAVGGVSAASKVASAGFASSSAAMAKSLAFGVPGVFGGVSAAPVIGAGVAGAVVAGAAAYGAHKAYKHFKKKR